MADEQEARFVDRVVGVVVETRQWIRENRCGLFEAHLVTPVVLLGLAIVPRKLERAESVPMHDLAVSLLYRNGETHKCKHRSARQADAVPRRRQPRSVRRTLSNVSTPAGKDV